MTKFTATNVNTGEEFPATPNLLAGYGVSNLMAEELIGEKDAWKDPDKWRAQEKVNALLSDFPSNAVNPSHYDFPGGVQVIDITKHLDFLTGNVVKYVCRAGRKEDRLTDLRKAEKYLAWAIEKEQNDER